MKIIFMGTPNFAVPILENLIKEHEVVLVVSQPDQYSKKQKTLVPTPVKAKAEEHGIKVIQPVSIKEDYKSILDYECDLIVTAAYGQFVPSVVLNHPKHKAINVHGSLLPKYRGGAPIQRSIMDGNKTTGISIMYMVKKMDAGDILAIKELAIEDSDTGDSMFLKLSVLGSEMILDVLRDIESGYIDPVKQNELEATFAYNLDKKDELIDFSLPARAVFNKIRALNSNPGAYLKIDGIDLKVYSSFESDLKTEEVPGVIVNVSKNSFEVSCLDGTVLSITEVQMPSKNIISAKEFLNGSGRKLIIKGKVIK